jgi:hypothetical protein
MLTTLIIAILVLGFALVVAIGHVLLFTAVLFGRGTVFGEGAKAPNRRPALSAN